MRTLRQGSRIFVLYDREEGLWHERILLAQLDEWSWVVLTPTEDIHEEDLSEVLEVVQSGERGGAPSSLYGKPLFRFRSRGAGYAADFIPDGELMAKEILDARAAAGGDGAGADVVPAGAAPAGAAPAAGLLALSPPGELPPDVFPHDVWVSLEDRSAGGVVVARAGEAVDVRANEFVCFGDRGVVKLDRVSVSVGLLGTTPDIPIAVKGTDTPRAEPTDARLLSASDAPRVGFSTLAARLKEGSRDKWKVQGPGTLKWLMDAHLEYNLSPVTRHYWWRQILGLAAADPGVDEHHFLCEILEVSIASDGLNTAALECFETISRRLQLWEEFYAEALRAAESGPGGHEWLDERRIFLGGSRSKGHALVCPALEQHVATKLKEESEVLKERRKGREERRLARGEEPGSSSAAPVPGQAAADCGQEGTGPAPKRLGRGGRGRG